MKRIYCILSAAAVLLALTACAAPASNTENASPASQTAASQEPASQELASQVQEGHSVPVESDGPENAAPEASASEALTLTVGGQTFTVTLADNESARELAELFPLTLNMSELNRNEKYFYLDSELPTDPYQPGQINAGDLMLYGNNCLVLFYESFSSGYSYTRLGRVDNSAGLAEVLGTGNVEVTFSLGDGM